MLKVIKIDLSDSNDRVIKVLVHDHEYRVDFFQAKDNNLGIGVDRDKDGFYINIFVTPELAIIIP